MLERERGVAIEVDERSVLVEYKLSNKGYVTRFHTRTHPGVDIGDWVEVAGGGIAGMYHVTRLAVFA
jgi:hypothetical protein